MTIQKNQLIAIVACLIATIALIGSAVAVLTNDNSTNSITLDNGSALTDAQLEKLKENAETDPSVKLTYNISNATVVFDSKAILNIGSVQELRISQDPAPASVPSTLDGLIGDNKKLVTLDYGTNTSFGDGKVTVTVPCDYFNSTDGLVCLYIQDSGEYEIVNVTVSDGKATFTTNHFSKYLITTVTPNHTMAGAGLKVLGNLDGNEKINESDLELLKKVVADGIAYELYPIADVNNDGQINGDDIVALQKIVDAVNGDDKAVIWHYNYHDTDGDGRMDVELVSTTFPITSAITTGSANTFIMLYTLGIVEEIKGASYSGTNDTWLYGDTYLDKTKVTRVGTSSTTIAFEDGKAGSSNVISEKQVTCVISDWNRSYLTNESAFRSANIDVVRVAAASFDPSTYTHSISLLGLLFQKEKNATKLLSYYNEAYNTIEEAVATLPADKIKKVVASSTTGAISSADSDYTAFCEAAGAAYGLSGYDFGGSSSINVSDNLGIFDNRKYNFDNIVHIRTALTYASTPEQVAKYWSEYANAMSLWDHAYDGQVLVSGSIPVPARVAYIAYAIYGSEIDTLSLDWANGIHDKLASLYKKDVSDAPNKNLVLNSYKFKVTVEDGVSVKTADGKEVKSGDEFVYGTKLYISAVTVKEGYILRADGSTIDADNSFIVCDNIRARYISEEIIDKLTTAADSFVKAYGEGVYGKASSAKDNEGTFTIAGTNSTGGATSKDFKFTYYDSPELAKAAFEELVKKDKGSILLDTSAFSDKFDGIYVKFSNNVSKTKPYLYSTIYLCAYKDNMVIDMVNTYLTTYCYDDDNYRLYKDDADGRLAFFEDGVTKFVAALAKAFENA